MIARNHVTASSPQPRMCFTRCKVPCFTVVRVSQRVSRECLRSVWDTFLTLRRHSRDTFWTLWSGPQDTSWDTPSDTPVFGDTPRDTRARRARETPVAGRRDRKPSSEGVCIFSMSLCQNRWEASTEYHNKRYNPNGSTTHTSCLYALHCCLNV